MPSHPPPPRQARVDADDDGREEARPLHSVITPIVKVFLTTLNRRLKANSLREILRDRATVASLMGAVSKNVQSNAVILACSLKSTGISVSQ